MAASAPFRRPFKPLALTPSRGLQRSIGPDKARLFSCP
jgi:hypothetical protein